MRYRKTFALLAGLGTLTVCERPPVSPPPDASAGISAPAAPVAVQRPPVSVRAVCSGSGFRHVQPHDVRIGALQPLEAPTEAARAAGVLSSFLDAKSRGRLAEELCAETSLEYLRRSIADLAAFEAGLADWRIGLIGAADGGTAEADLRLFFPNGEAIGRAYLARMDGNWRLTGLTVSGIERESEWRHVRFEP